MEKHTVLIGSIAPLLLSPLVVVMTGESNFYALSLVPLLVVVWLLTRLSKDEMGIQLGNLRAYAIAFFYPVMVMGVTGLICWMSDSIQASHISVVAVCEQVIVLFLLSFIIGLATEEGFFRGWLWGALERCAYNPLLIVVWTSGVFSLWHFAVPFIVPDLEFPLIIVPVYLVNCFLIGIIWGLLRLTSGSIAVTSLSHAVWNALTYTLYGYGSETGVLDISFYQIFDPERGVLGLLLNFIFVVILWQWHTKKVQS